jgi:hypothetical protein
MSKVKLYREGGFQSGWTESKPALIGIVTVGHSTGKAEAATTYGWRVRDIGEIHHSPWDPCWFMGSYTFSASVSLR